MQKIIFSALAYLLLSSQIQAAPVPVSKVWQLDDCGGGRGNTSGCETADPYIAFTDVISGPDTGLGDGLGSGTIVTVWGFGLGPTQDNSTIQYCDSASVCRSASHVYYWKNADGNLPGGPADLYESHGMQEIAFSIPDSASGAGTIRVNVRGEVSNTLPFTVRAGNIYWVRPGGSNAENCSFANPCEFIDAGLSFPGYTNALGNERLQPGDIVYSQAANEPGQAGGGRDVGMYLRGLSGTLSNQIALVSYPGTRAFISNPSQGVTPYLTSGIVVSKYQIEVGYKDPGDPIGAGSTIYSNTHVRATENGRTVGNLLTQIANKCINGWSGAIVSNGMGGSNHKIYGNHIDSLGCDNTSKFQHTLYMSVRGSDGDPEPQAWEIGYNYLDNNNVLYGLHNYDETYSGDCANLQGTLKIHNNVVFNQRGTGINVSTRDLSAPENFCWANDLEVYNNALINVGLGAPQESGTAPNAIVLDGDADISSVKVFNNIVYGYGEVQSVENAQARAIAVNFDLADPTVIVENNIFVQSMTFGENRMTWIDNFTETVTADNNIFWNLVTGDQNGAPAWNGSIYADPQISLVGSNLSLSATSPALGAGGTTRLDPRDIYGNLRPANVSIGATEE
jgi:hypothetical protein